MGGERASITRQRLAGKICARCRSYLPPSDQPGERLCTACTPRYRVLMNFVSVKDGWQITFLEHDCRTKLAMELTFADSDKIREMSQRNGSQVSADICSMEYGISLGRGAVWLMVDQAEYQV